MTSTEIKNDIFWVGAIDWNVRDFHGYSIPSGTSYNAYLVKDQKTVLFDTVKKEFLDTLLLHIGQVVEPEKIDYIVVNHVEMDHSGALPMLIDIVKPEKVICSAMGKRALLAHYHRDDWPYEVVATGDSIDIGSRTIKFIETRMLHWPDSMMSYIPQERLLISQDGFGQHWATSERFDDEVDLGELMYQAKKYFANILMLYSNTVQKLLGEVRSSGVEIDMIAPDHGLIWRSHVGDIVQSYDDWSLHKCKAKALVVYDTMWHSTEMMAMAFAEGLEAEGVSVKVCDLSVSHRADVMTELLDAKAVVFGSSTINNSVLPRVADMLAYMKGLRPAGKIGAAFGSYGWGGEGVKYVAAMLEEMKFEMIDEPLKVVYVPTADDLARCTELGRKIGQAVKESQ